MTQALRTFLTFQGGVANAALELHADVFDDFEIVSIAHYGPAGPGLEGTVMSARFRLSGAEFGCADSRNVFPEADETQPPEDDPYVSFALAL